MFAGLPNKIAALPSETPNRISGSGPAQAVHQAISDKQCSVFNNKIFHIHNLRDTVQSCLHAVICRVRLVL